MKTIILTHAAAKDLDSLPGDIREQVGDAIVGYATTGRGDVKKLAGREGYRMRVGRYRVIFAEDAQTILAVYVGKRSPIRETEDEMTKLQIITTPSGEELVVMPRDDYEALVRAVEEAGEDAADAAVFDARMAELRAGRDDRLPAEVSASMLRGLTLVKALRKWRGLKQREVAERSGVAQGFLSDIEGGRRAGSRETLEKIATALNAPLAWLL